MEDRKQRESQEMAKRDIIRRTHSPCLKVLGVPQNSASTWKVAFGGQLKFKPEARVAVRQVQAGNAKESICILLPSVGITLVFHDTSIFKNERLWR